MYNYNNRNTNGNNKNNNKNYNKPTYGNSVPVRIDIGKVYTALKLALTERARLQLLQDKEWVLAKQGHNRHAQMKHIDKAIGVQTHAINCQIATLAKYKKTHKAMNMACDYIRSEISRIDKIVSHQRKSISSVERGHSVWYTSSGVSHTDSTNMLQYVQHKLQQRAKLACWLGSISRYVA